MKQVWVAGLSFLMSSTAWARTTEQVAPAAVSSSVEVTSAPTGSVNGLYPLWEATAVLHAPWTGQVGWQHAQLSFGRVQIGTRPFMDLYGALNGELKVGLWRSDSLQGALLLSGFFVPTAAESRSLGNLHATGFSNPYATVWLVPAAFALSARLGPRVGVHGTSTALSSFSKDPANRNLSFGQALMAEVFASPVWALRVHGGVEGLAVEARGYLGLSFAYTSRHVHVAAGVARRISFQGEGVNLALLDAALLFR